MSVSHLTDSVAVMLASALNTLTGGSFSHLTMGEDEMLARVVSEMTGQTYSHLTVSREVLWELMLTQATTDGITFDRLTQSPEQIMAIIANNVSGGGGAYEGPLDLVPGADWIGAFSSARALSAAKRGSENYIIKELTGNTSQGFSLDAVTGLMDAAAITAFIDGAEAGATWWQNQCDTEAHVTNDHEAPWTSDPLPWIASSQGGHPAFGTGARLRSTVTVPVLSGSATLFIVAKGAADLDVDQQVPDARYVQVVGGQDGYVDMYDGTNETGGNYSVIGNDAFYVLSCTVQQGENVLSLNGARLMPEMNDLESGGPIESITAANIMLSCAGEAQEFLVADGILDPEDIRAVVENMAAAFGITLSVTAPVITPDPAVAGDLLSVSTGTWAAGANPVYTYQWWRNGVLVVGATNPTYQTVNPGDVNQSIHCIVTNTNDDGSGFAVSIRTPYLPAP